ncbi:MAG: GGDEF domain-containing protein [Gammaproteobacteria bacterium]
MQTMITPETGTPESDEKQEVARLLVRRSFLPHFSRQLKQLFLQSYSHHNRLRMRITLALGLVIYLLCGGGDILLGPGSTGAAGLIGYGFTASVIAGALCAVFWMKRDIVMQFVYAVAALAAGAGTAWLAHNSPPGAVLIYSLGVVVILFYIYVISGMRIGYALPSALLVTGLYLADMFMYHPLSMAAWHMIIVQLAVTNLVGAYAGYRLEKEARRSFLDGRMVRLLNNEMIELVGVDELTGLANRRRMDEFYVNTWNRAQRDKAELALLLIDVDCLTLLNDHLGRHIGDICLRKLGAVIQHCRRRPGDLAARYEGGKFLVLLYSCNERHARVIAERLRRDIESLNLMNPASTVGWTVTVSIGVHAVVPGRAQSSVSALAAADTLLYMAKQRGRNQVLSDNAALSGKTASAAAEPRPQPVSDKTVILPRTNTAP